MVNTFNLLLFNRILGFFNCGGYILPNWNDSWDLFVVLMRDKKHLAFIRTLPCCVCLRMDTVQACHIRLGLPAHEKGGMGMKPHDKWTTPKCHECHSQAHNCGEKTFWGDMKYPIGLAENLYSLTGDREKAIQCIIKFNREFRREK